MTENNTHNLKDTLFATLDGLMNKTIDAQTAKAISDTAQTILNAAKVEMDFARLCNQNPENFLSGKRADITIPPPSNKNITHPKPGVTVHRMK